jgi:hypothetical protein
VISSNYVKEQLDAIMFSFPPYFPAGTPQRLDLIKGVRGVQEEIKNSKLPNDVKEKLAGQKLTDTATDQEVSTALIGLKQYKDEHLPAAAQSTKESQPASIVSIQI